MQDLRGEEAEEWLVFEAQTPEFTPPLGTITKNTPPLQVILSVFFLSGVGHMCFGSLEGLSDMKWS